MKTLVKTLSAAALATAIIAAPSANAQVTGNIATVSGTEVILKTTALQAAYQQIGTTYATQRTTANERTQARQALLVQLDTNNDGQLDEAEQAAAQNTPQIQQIQALEQEINGLRGQIELARIYAIEQLLRQYGPALQQVVQQKQIQMVFPLEGITFAQPAANIGDQVVAVLNGLVPTVGIVPPANWQPSRQSVAMYQEIQQALTIAQAQAQAQAAQPPAAPAQPAPSGR